MKRTNEEIMRELRQNGMGPEAERLLKEFIQLQEKGLKAYQSQRKAKQHNYRINAVWPKVSGLGLYWFNEYAKEKEKH